MSSHSAKLRWSTICNVYIPHRKASLLNVILPFCTENLKSRKTVCSRLSDHSSWCTPPTPPWLPQCCDTWQDCNKAFCTLMKAFDLCLTSSLCHHSQVLTGCLCHPLFSVLKLWAAGNTSWSVGFFLCVYVLKLYFQYNLLVTVLVGTLKSSLCMNWPSANTTCFLPFYHTGK